MRNECIWGAEFFSFFRIKLVITFLKSRSHSFSKNFLKEMVWYMHDLVWYVPDLFGLLNGAPGKKLVEGMGVMLATDTMLAIFVHLASI